MTFPKFLYRLYGVSNQKIRGVILKMTNKIEGGEFYSVTLRQIFKDYHNVDVGMYTHGGCFIPGMVDKYTTIGRYCSIAKPVTIRNRNHPLELKSTHGFFFNPNLKICDEDFVKYIPLVIGSDVWLGQNSIIMPHVSKIEHGAVVGAGAVVNKNVPPYAVVVGNPARIVRYRFSKEVIEELLESKWWERSIEEIKSSLHEFRHPYEDYLKSV